MNMLSTPIAKTKKGSTSRIIRDAGYPKTANKPIDAETLSTTLTIPTTPMIIFEDKNIAKQSHSLLILHLPRAKTM